MENDHIDHVSKHLRLSLPNASGALTMVTAAVSGAGGIVDEVHRLHENTRRRSEGPLLLPSALDPVLHLRVAHAVRDSVQQEQAGPATGRPPSLPTKEESYDVAR